jgi:hypothetical protein
MTDIDRPDDGFGSGVVLGIFATLLTLVFIYLGWHFLEHRDHPDNPQTQTGQYWSGYEHGKMTACLRYQEVLRDHTSPDDTEWVFNCPLPPRPE